MWSRDIKVEGMFGHERWWVTTDERLACLLAMNEADEPKGLKDDLVYNPEETNGYFSYSLS